MTTHSPGCPHIDDVINQDDMQITWIQLFGEVTSHDVKQPTWKFNSIFHQDISPVGVRHLIDEMYTATIFCSRLE